MKLSEKGLKRLLDVAFDGDEFYQSNALEVEFEPDDFQGGYFQNGKDHIVLTVEEAKRIVDSLHRSIQAHVEVSRLTNGWTEVSIEVNDIYMLQERIKQAEKDNGTNQ